LAFISLKTTFFGVVKVTVLGSCPVQYVFTEQREIPAQKRAVSIFKALRSNILSAQCEKE
jgi:hypothetical protein